MGWGSQGPGLRSMSSTYYREAGRRMKEPERQSLTPRHRIKPKEMFLKIEWQSFRTCETKISFFPFVMEQVGTCKGKQNDLEKKETVFSLYIWVEWVILQSWFTQEKRGRCEFQHIVSEAEVTRGPLGPSPQRQGWDPQELSLKTWSLPSEVHVCEPHPQGSVWVTDLPLSVEVHDDGAIFPVWGVGCQPLLLPLGIQDNDHTRGWGTHCQERSS